jgi:tetratricopeptide (TPR) repeat protein
MQRVIIFLILSLFLSGTVFSIEIDEAKFRFAQKLYEQKNYKQSFSEFSEFTSKYHVSLFFNKALYYLGKSAFALGNHKKALESFLELEERNGNDLEKRQLLFGIGESYYHLKDYTHSAASFLDFALRFTNSPARPASFYYAAHSYEALNMPKEAGKLYEYIVLHFKESRYYQEAAEKIKITNLNIVVLEELETGALTNMISNQGVQTDTNALAGEEEMQESKKRLAEVERYQELIELKAKLLELKEKAIQEKNKWIQETNEEPSIDVEEKK